MQGYSDYNFKLLTIVCISFVKEFRQPIDMPPDLPISALIERVLEHLYPDPRQLADLEYDSHPYGQD